MAKRDVPVVIIGAGPAGSVCANLLKEAGTECVLVDFRSFPRDKVCGGGLTPRAWHVLDDMMPDFQYDYVAIKRFRLMVNGRIRAQIETTYEQRNVCRKDFDNALLQRFIKLGGEFVQDSFLRFEEQQDGRILVTMRSGLQILCRYLVAADGANSRVRKQLLGPYGGNVLFWEQDVKKGDGVLEGEFSSRYYCGYYYRFPQKDYDIVGYGAKDASVEGFRKLLTDMGIAETKIRGANIPVEVVESGRDDVILIGDAGGFVNKLTYEGLYYALVTGRNAAKAILNGIPFTEANKDIFRRKRREKWITDMFYSWFGQWLVRVLSGNRRIVKWALEKVSGV